MTIIQLTDELIDGCEGGSFRSCVVACAMRPVLEEDVYAYVTADWIELYRQGLQEPLCRIDVPRDVGDWIMRWDEWKRFVDDHEGDWESFWRAEGLEEEDLEPDRPEEKEVNIDIPKGFLRCP